MRELSFKSFSEDDGPESSGAGIFNGLPAMPHQYGQLDDGYVHDGYEGAKKVTPAGRRRTGEERSTIAELGSAQR